VTASLGIAKEICAAAGPNPQQLPSMTVPEFEARLVDWARAQRGIEALLQIGSRAQPGAVVDAWSDWDYQLVASDPGRYENRDWPAQIAPCWSAHLERTPRGVMKVSAIFTGGWEVDFVLLPAWQMKLVYWAMAHPGLQPLYPRALRQGIANTRLWARPGCRVVIGGPAWEKRLAALAVVWPEGGFTAGDFLFHTAGFWRHAVWTAKKILRGELRAAHRWMHLELREHTYALLAEEARLAGRTPRPEARQAEQWLDAARLRQTAITTGPGQRELARALLAELELFREVTQSVGTRHGWTVPDHTAVESWLRTELAKSAG
jgi:aminoglycoside 6-adenylyltransferase